MSEENSENTTKQSEATFSLYFTSRLVSGENKDLATKKLAKEFGFGYSKAQKLVLQADEAPVLIRDDVSHSEAKTIINKINQCGFRCELVAKKIDILYEEAEINEDGEKIEKARLVTCPKCFHQQYSNLGELCESCSFAINKAIGAPLDDLAEKLEEKPEQSVYRSFGGKSAPAHRKRKLNRQLTPKVFSRENLNKLKTALPFALLLIFLFTFPLSRFFMWQFTEVLVHEIGHTLFFWSFGYVAIPTINFLGYGEIGGFAMTLTEQNKLIIHSIHLAMLYFLYRALPWPTIFASLLFIVLVYFFISISPIHRQVVTFMGHGSIPLFSAFLLFHGLLDDHEKSSILRPIQLAFAILFAYIAMKNLIFFPLDISQIPNSNNDFEKILRQLEMSPILFRFLFTFYTFLTYAVSLYLYNTYDSWADDFVSYRRSLSRFGVN